MLTASNLVKRYAGFTAVDDVSLSIERGRITACVGPNGAGKSTLVGLLSGAIPMDGGRILLDEADISSASAWSRAGMGLRRTFQNVTGIPEMTVRHNLQLGQWRNRGRAAGSGQAGLRTVEGVADLLGLSEHLDARLDELSLGVQRKVGIGVAMLGGPSYLLLDEPLAGTEPGDRVMLLRVFRDLAAVDLGIMWIEHDLASVRSTADALLVIDKGQAIAHGPVEAVVKDPVVQEAYWGSAGHG